MHRLRMTRCDNLFVKKFSLINFTNDRTIFTNWLYQAGNRQSFQDFLEKLHERLLELE